MRALAAWLVVLGLLAADLGLASDLFRVYAQGARGLPAISSTDGAAAPGAADSLPEPVAFDLPPLGTFAAAVERPLFSPARRPPEPGVEAVEAVLPAELELDLIGVVITDKQRIAVLLPRERRRRTEALRLSLGEDHNGWVLKAIEPLSATFERDGELRTLDLLFDRPQAVDPRLRVPRHRR